MTFQAVAHAYSVRLTTMAVLLLIWPKEEGLAGHRLAGDLR